MGVAGAWQWHTGCTGTLSVSVRLIPRRDLPICRIGTIRHSGWVGDSAGTAESSTAMGAALAGAAVYLLVRL